ncbi:hypothetical protein ACIRF8_34140 [Streptomyces sp. NPDC102406]
MNESQQGQDELSCLHDEDDPEAGLPIGPLVFFIVLMVIVLCVDWPRT